MPFDQTWEEIFRTKKWGRYPSEEIVRFIATRFNSCTNRSNIRILDIGCGGGAHTWFLAREGFETHGIDGSPSAIRQAQALVADAGLRAHLSVGDFTQTDYPAEFFDAVIDVSAIQHNCRQEIQRVHDRIWSTLKPGGHFGAIMINTETSGWQSANKLEENTFRNFIGGSIQHGLLVHFFTEAEIRELLANYEELTIEKTTRTVDNGRVCFGHFVVAGRKPANERRK